MLNSCQTSPTVQATSTVQPTDPPVATEVPEMPTPTATPGIIKASDQPIKIGDFSIIITFKGYIDLGYNATGAEETMALQWSITEENGKEDQVAALNAMITDAQGQWIEGSMSESGTNFEGKNCLTYNVYTSDATGEFYLTFPSGEIIELPR